MSVRKLGISSTLKINEKSNLLIDQGHKIYKLGLGQSPFPVYPSVVQALKDNAHQKNYLPVKGLPALREAVARFHQIQDDVDIDPENVIIGPGSKELLFLLQLTYYGEIIVPSPAWVTYIPQANIIGRTIQIVHTTFTENWRIYPDALKEILENEEDVDRPRLLMLNYPGNPDGGTYSESELREIALVAKDYGILILSDEIYGKLNHKNEHVSIAKFYPEGTIISSGLSKWAGAGGWRLGTFSFPHELKWLMNGIASVASETYTSVSAPIQYAAVKAFEFDENIELYVRHCQRILSSIGQQSANTLKIAGIRVQDPQGAFYLFPDFSDFYDRFVEKRIRSSSVMVDRLLKETGVACLPGVNFGRPSIELTARLAYVNFDGAKALEASNEIGLNKKLPNDFGDTYAPETLTAMRKISQWIIEEIKSKVKYEPLS
ncbi:MAG: Aspartate aminotransferase [Candidatus Heimdallarchaeota archaeon LC_3]|nr:MAG: Aspartate aminotransferase [Candidatus Heimdallarchaeota archaeon LC_3]